MDERHRTLLRRHTVNFRKDLEPKKLLPYLVTVLDATDEQEIKNQPTREDQVDKLLDLLPRRGPQAFVCFIEALDNVQPYLGAPLREEEDMEKKMIEMKAELGRARTHSAKLRDELRIANCSLESEKNKKDNLHKELDELKSLHRALLCQSRTEKDKLTFNLRELTANREHLAKKLETEKQQKVEVEKKFSSLEKELEKQTVQIEKLNKVLQHQTRLLTGHTTEEHDKQLASRKLSYDELKTREKHSSRTRTYSEKQTNDKNALVNAGSVSRLDINDNIDELYFECEEMLQCMKHSVANLELQKQLDQMAAERDLALDTCKQFEEQVRGYEEKMRNRVDVGTDVMESNELQCCSRCMTYRYENEQIKQQLEKDLSKLTEETKLAESTMKEMTDKYEREKKCLESNLHKLEELHNTSREEFASEIKKVRSEMTEQHLNEIQGLEHAKNELESQIEREKHTILRLKTDLDKEKESAKTVHKEYDKYKKKAIAEKKQMKKKLDEEVKSKSTCLKELEAELKESKEDGKKCADDISRLQAVIRDQQNIQESLREELTRWRTLPGRVFNYKKDFDRNGIIYSFGTSFSTAQFTNPASKDNCRIRVTRSSNEEGHAMDILDPRKSTLCCTKDEEHSWWQVDFGEEHALFVTHYTLRHGRDNGLSILRNWNLEGSHDGKKWEILRKHENDRGMKGTYPFYTGTWTVEKRVQAMRYFRIHQTGKNSSGRYALYLSGFEIYGVLLDMC